MTAVTAATCDHAFERNHISDGYGGRCEKCGDKWMDIYGPQLPQRTAGEASFIAGLLAEALRQHRRDMHQSSSRPCETCRQSGMALSAYDEWATRESRSPVVTGGIRENHQVDEKLRPAGGLTTGSREQRGVEGTHQR